MSAKLQIAIEEMNTARADADSANAAKSMFLANVSHELRTPLNAIIGYSEMLQDELGDGLDIDREQFHHDLATIIFSGNQLLTLINDILDLSKIETGKMQVSLEVFSPAALLVQVCDALSLFCRKTTTVSFWTSTVTACGISTATAVNCSRSSPIYFPTPVNSPKRETSLCRHP
ncbi:MAG: hypothetical protein CM15mP74_33270 [Halieaceae bacterium]|nr:MAG: hypothetical protein CM15mP74_33270 [Halieaceae bacterium]